MPCVASRSIPTRQARLRWSRSLARTDEALALLRAPDLVERIAGDLDRLGWVGEPEAKRLAYLAATSRKLADPMWALLVTSPGAGAHPGLDLIAALTPPEEVVHVSRLTDSALYYQDANALRHKLLAIDEAGSLTAEVLLALRVLQTRGALSISHVNRSPIPGAARAEVIEARGPVAVLTAATDGIDAHFRDRCVLIPADESPEQTARVLAAQRRLRADPALATVDGERASIIRRHHALQRLLLRRSVLVPYAERIEFPPSRCGTGATRTASSA